MKRRATLGIFTPVGQMGGWAGLGDELDDAVAQCLQLAAISNGDTSSCTRENLSKWETELSGKRMAACGTSCAQYRPDTVEWENCTQKCHGLPPSDESKNQAACKAKGMVYSWLNGCVPAAKMNGCPAGTMYANYADGSERCIGYAKDGQPSATCPVGTALQPVPGGQTCVSNVKPGTVGGGTKTPGAGGKTNTPVTPEAKKGLSLAGMSGLTWIGLGAATLVLVLLTLKSKRRAPETETDTDMATRYPGAAKNPRRRNARNPPKTRPLSDSLGDLKRIVKMPTISHGQYDDLKYDDGKFRVWVSRMTVQDGAPCDNEITYECLDEEKGRWETFESFEPSTGKKMR